MDSIPNLYWSIKSEGKSSQETRGVVASGASRVGYTILAAVFIAFFIADELLHKYRESRLRKFSIGQNRASSQESRGEGER